MFASWLPSRATPTMKTTTRNITPTMKSTRSSPPLLFFPPISTKRNSRGSQAPPSEWKNLLSETLRAPLNSELARRGHVAEQRGRSDDRGAREIAEATDAHTVGPVSIERGDRAFALAERVGPLTEAGSAPGLADLGARGAEDVGDRLAAEPRIGLLDIALDAARAGKHDELLGRARCPLRARRSKDERCLEKVAVPAVRARPDERLVEGDPLARDLGCRERVRWTERLRNQWHDLGEIERLVDLVASILARRESRVGEVRRALLAIPRVRDVVRREDPVQCLALGHHVRDRIAVAHRELQPGVDELDAHALRLLLAPSREQREDDILAAYPRLQLSGEHHTALLRDGEIHVARCPPEAECGRAHAVPERAVCAVRAAVRIGARYERAGEHELLLGKVEVEDSIARRRVMRPLDAVPLRELAANTGLLVVGLPMVEDEVVVRDRDLARPDRVAAGDRVEGVDREGRGPIGGGQEVGVHAQGRAWPHLGLLVDAVRPKDLFGRGEASRRCGVGPPHGGCATDGFGKLASADLDDPAGAADLLLLRRERRRLVALASSLVRQLPGRRVERERVALLRLLDCLAALDHVEAEVEGVPPEDVAHRGATHDDHLDSGFIGDALEAGGTHLARASDGEPVAGDDERLSAMDPFAEVRHEVTEGPCLPALVQRVEALRNAVAGRRDLVRVDGVELLSGHLGIPEDERLSPDGLALGRSTSSLGRRCLVDACARYESRPLDRLHASMVSRPLVTTCGAECVACWRSSRSSGLGSSSSSCGLSPIT